VGGSTTAWPRIARNFLQTQTNTNVLSTPNLMTLDNEEAKIVIGTQRALCHRSVHQHQLGNRHGQPVQTIERKDVGLTLRSSRRSAKTARSSLAIYQESLQVATGATVNAVNGPTTSKRSIESNVLVDDGSIMVLGGLLEDSYSRTGRGQGAAAGRRALWATCSAAKTAHARRPT
jgi:general secretion pathway protein D